MSKTMKRLAGLSIALTLGLTGVTVGAQTTTSTQSTASLQAQIASLLALITQLQAQLNGQTGVGGTGTTVTTGFMFTSDLTMGSTGAQVTELQRFLVMRGYLTMPNGVAYGYFGNLTRAALARFQAANAIAPAAGYFGPITRGRINSMLIVVVPNPNPGTGTTTPGTGSGVITTPGVEGTMSVTESNAGVNSTVYEGQSNVAVLGFRVEARTSDIAVQRVRVNLGNSSTLYNKIFSRVYVSSGSNTLASRDLNSNEVIREGNTYYIDISGFNYIVPRNSTRDLQIRVDVRPSIDSTDLTSNYTVSLADNGVRGIDGAGIDHYSPSSGSSISRSLNVDESLSESATLRISLNTSTPQTQGVIASSGTNQNEYDRLTALMFDVRAERDDVTITDLTVNIAKSGTGGATASSTVYLYDGSNEIENTSVSSGGVATFTNLDYTIPRDTTRTLSVKMDVRNANVTPSTFTVSIPSSGITAENRIGDQLNTSDISGSATGYALTVRNTGPEITLVSKSVTTSGVPQGSGSNNLSTSTLTATFNLRVRALGDDVVLGTTASSSPAFGSSTAFRVYKNGAYDASIGSAATSTSYSVPSGATTAGLTNSFMIPEGTEVTIPVTFQILGRKPDGSPLPSGLYSVGFEGFNWQGGGMINTTNFMAGQAEWRTQDVSFP